MTDAIRPYLARIVGSVVGAVAVWLAGKYGVKLTGQTQAQLTDTSVSMLMLVFGIVYSVVHKATSSATNPADAATVALSAKGKADQHQLGS